MSLLVEGYTQVSNALEDWMHVLREATENDPSHVFQYLLLLQQLEILHATIQPIRKSVAEMEDAFKNLGLTPRNDPSELDKLWGNTESE